ncbi:hypothetical protein T06_1424 [Trichinella sp. T6]|nr:hypothetical protein T06_1424 [Trichinella sp. T6]
MSKQWNSSTELGFVLLAKNNKYTSFTHSATNAAHLGPTVIHIATSIWYPRAVLAFPGHLSPSQRQSKPTFQLACQLNDRGPSKDFRLLSDNINHDHVHWTERLISDLLYYICDACKLPLRLHAVGVNDKLLTVLTDSLQAEKKRPTNGQ